MIVTLDCEFAQGRDWGSPGPPERLECEDGDPVRGLRSRRPEMGDARHDRPDGCRILTVPNMAAAGEQPTLLRGEEGRGRPNSCPTAEDVPAGCGEVGLGRSWSRRDTGRWTRSGRVAAGVTAIPLSNHGGTT